MVRHTLRPTRRFKGLGKEHAWSALAQHFQSVNSILCGYDVKCQTANVVAMAAPAWTVEREVTFNTAHLPDLKTSEDFIVATGVDYHELGHVRFSPSVAALKAVFHGSPSPCPMAMGLESGMPDYKLAWNLLEDQRIELLITTEYKKSRRYFTMMMTTLVLAGNPDREFLFTHGRRYLPLKLRKMARRNFVDQSLVKRIAKCIDTYRLLNLTTVSGIETADKCIREMMDILSKLPTPPNMGCGAHHYVTAGRVAYAQTGSPDETGDILARVKGEGKGKGKPGKAEDGKEDDGNDRGEGPPTPEEMDDALGDLSEAIANDDSVKQDVNQARRYVDNADAINADTLRMSSFKPVPTECNAIARQVVIELRKVEEDLDPHWRTHQNEGRINIRRAMHATGYEDDLHDQWDAGSPGGSDIEMVTLLDQSSSMGKHVDKLSIAAWSLKRATDALRISHTMFGYGGEHAGSTKNHRVIYGPKERAMNGKCPNLLNDLKNTKPAPALKEAFNVLAKSKRGKKLLVIMTDGSWQSSSARMDNKVLTAEEIIEEMNGQGWVTALVFLGDTKVEDQYIPRHSCTLGGSIMSMTEFPIFVRNVLVRELKKNQSRRR